MKRALTSLLVITLLGIGVLHAANVETPIPENAFITKDGLDWAWAYPLPASSGGFDLSYQSQFGWRLPTGDELLSAPLATDFIFQGANVPLGGTDPVSGAYFDAPSPDLNGAAACAVPYFSSGQYNKCDWVDGNGQEYEPWAGLPGAYSVADQLVVRGQQEIPVPVPSLGQYAVILLILLAGTLGVFTLRRMRG